MSLTLGLLVVWGCVARSEDEPDISTRVDDTSVDTADGDTDADTDRDTDSGDTGFAPLAGSLHVRGAWKGAPFVVDCTEADGDATFVGYWSDALGNVAGSVGCYRAEGARPWVSVTFSRGSVGEWTAPGDATWMIGDEDGAWSDGSGDSATTSWALAFTEFARVDVDTYTLSGTLAGEWAASDGGGSVTGSFDALLPCSGACP